MRSKWILPAWGALASFPLAFGASFVGHARVPTIGRQGRAVVSAASTSPIETIAQAQGAPSGSLVVEVPYTPPRNQILRICKSLAAGQVVPPSRALAGLTAETGGSPKSTSDWCATYLRLSGTAQASG